MVTAPSSFAPIKSSPLQCFSLTRCTSQDETHLDVFSSTFTVAILADKPSPTKHFSWKKCSCFLPTKSWKKNKRCKKEIYNYNTLKQHWKLDAIHFHATSNDKMGPTWPSLIASKHGKPPSICVQHLPPLSHGHPWSKFHGCRGVECLQLIQKCLSEFAHFSLEALGIPAFFGQFASVSFGTKVTNKTPHLCCCVLGTSPPSFQSREQR